MRLLRTNSSNATFEELLTKFILCLEACGYPKSILERSLSGVNFASRPSALKQKNDNISFCYYIPPCSDKSQIHGDGKLEFNTKSAVAENHL